MPIERIVTSSSGDDDARQFVCDYNFGENLDVAAETFGEENVFNLFKAQAKVQLQALIRRLMNREKPGPASDEEIATAVGEWKPAAKVVNRVSKKEKAAKLLSGMSPEEIAEILAEVGDEG